MKSRRYDMDATPPKTVEVVKETPGSGVLEVSSIVTDDGMIRLLVVSEIHTAPGETSKHQHELNYQQLLWLENRIGHVRAAMLRAMRGDAEKTAQ